MENKAHALLAGLFTVGLLAAAIAIATWFRGDRSEQATYEIATTLAVPGLTPQATVRYRGLEVGKVQNIGFNPEVPGQILIKLTVQPNTPVTATTYATLGYQGVTGLTYIELDDDQRIPTPDAGATAKRIEMRPSLLDRLQTQGLDILMQTEQVAKRINELLDPANQKKVITALDNVSRAADALEQIPRQLAPTLARLPALTEQAQQTLASVNAAAKDAGALAANLSELTTTLQRPDGTVAKFTTTVDQFGAVANRLETEILPLAADARSTLRALNRTIESVRDRPQSLIFGSRRGEPGPGEPGFVAPAN